MVTLLVLQELVMVVQEHMVEQWKQMKLLVQLVCIQELDCVDWVGMGVEDSEMGSEESEEMEIVVVHCPNTYTVMPKKPNRNWELRRSATAGQCIYA